MNAALDRHQKIALQLSGGRDSIACLYLLAEFLNRITVYWLNTGDAFPETLVAIEQCKKIIPDFVEVTGDRAGVIEAFGHPSDIVPATHTGIGVVSGKGGFLLQDRYSCCARTSMAPMHQRMIADGVTLIIRGQRNSDALKSPVRSGDIVDGIEFLFPIENWDDAGVMDFLKSVGAPIPRFYEMLSTTPDCMGCTAYWEDGRAAYLKKYHPDRHKEYLENLQAIQLTLIPSIDALLLETKIDEEES